MRYALAHPLRTARWLRYRLAYALAERRKAMAALRREESALRAWRARIGEASAGPPDRGEVISRTFIGRDGEMAILPTGTHGDDRFDQRLALAPRDADGRLRLW